MEILIKILVLKLQVTHMQLCGAQSDPPDPNRALLDTLSEQSEGLGHHTQFNWGLNQFVSLPY